MKQFVLGAVTMLTALVVAALVLVWSVGSPGSGADVPAPTASAAPRPSAPTDLASGETWLGDVRLTSAQVVTGDGGLRDVTAIGSAVRLDGEGLRAGRLDIDALLPFESAASQIGDGVTLYAADDGLAGLRRRVNVLGRDVEVRATGAVRAVDGRLVITPETIDLDGPDWLDSAASTIVRQLVTIRHTVQGVPEGMALTAVSVQAEGFRAHLRGDDVSITR
ncbi:MULTISPECIES: LmeA family phospholipid-binding protein [unclassified Knoellia]|uniref:LmeA family phospholipid-binding protein n=1 Tax=Knoellia altitudinis TaxID=3404795 RepID=UPI00361A3C9F